MKNILTIITLTLLFTSCNNTQTPEDLKYNKIQEQIKEGNTFPNFNELDHKNNPVSNKDFNKGHILYMFWGTWCSSCIDNIVAVRDMKKLGLLKNIEFVSVSVDKKEEDWKQFIYQYDMEDYMTNIRIGKNRQHTLSDFMYKVIYSSLSLDEESKSYHYITPAYCLVKDGIIVDNQPILPKEKEDFLNKFDK